MVAPQLVVLRPNKCAAMAQLRCQLRMACIMASTLVLSNKNSCKSLVRFRLTGTGTVLTIAPEAVEEEGKGEGVAKVHEQRLPKRHVLHRQKHLRY